MAAVDSSKMGVSQRNRPNAALPLNITLDETTARGVTGLHFVVSNSLEKPDPELRKFIRSHVMQGKNQGRKLPPRKKKPKAGQEPPISSSDAYNRDIHGSWAPSTTAVLLDPVLAVTIPRSFGSGMSTISFADTLEPGTIEVVLQCEFNTDQHLCQHKVLSKNGLPL